MPTVVSDFAKLPCNGILITAARKLTCIDLRLEFSQQTPRMRACILSTYARLIYHAWCEIRTAHDRGHSYEKFCAFADVPTYGLHAQLLRRLIRICPDTYYTSLPKYKYIKKDNCINIIIFPQECILDIFKQTKVM